MAPKPVSNNKLSLQAGLRHVVMDNTRYANARSLA